MKVKILTAINACLLVCIASLAVCQNVQQKQIAELEKAVQHYEERQQAFISRDKALQIELADLKKYVQENKGGAGG